ncbi:MAG TPA: type IX secretion system sortase PorU [Cyclobacteriaceae bacterium]|nr:type IX secretion system sortase PorU [Cyclobacteriaceae bacterium]
MRTVLYAGILTWLLFLPALSHAQTNPTAFKFKVTQNGIYRLTYDDLKNAGLDPASINPATLSLMAYPTGMLPQANSANQQPGNRQVAIKITGKEDGSFDKGDEIIFYGQGPDKYEYNSAKRIFAYQNNLYSDDNFYFLYPQGTPSYMQTSNLPAGSRPLVSEFIDLGYYENDEYNDQKSGREWFGEQFDVKKDITIRFDKAGIIPNSEIRFVSNLMAQSYQPSSFKLFWNNNQFLDRQIDTIPQTTYGPKGAFGVDTLTLNANTVGASSTSTQDIKIAFTKGGGNRSVGYLNYIVFAVKRKPALYGNFTVMHIPAQQNAESNIDLSPLSSEAVVWDITDPFNGKEVTVTNGTFATATDVNKTFAVFTKDAYKTPEFAGKVPGDLSVKRYGSGPVSLLIVSHRSFIYEAQRLAEHRASTYGIGVEVISTEQIFNEYSGGRQDVSAIRNYVRKTWLDGGKQLRNLLLFGRGSYDYKDRVFNNSNFVPIYESRNSLDPLLTYASDDYYGFLEDNEGTWSEFPQIDHTLDIGVGRLPFVTNADASTVVSKLIAYDKSSDQSLWKSKILFVADDGDWNIHQSQAEELAESFEVVYKDYQTSKVYLDAFEQQSTSSGQASPKAREALARELNKGYDIVNYTGHGSERVWMQERILDPETPGKMKNSARLPLFLTATCEFGRHDDPLITSTAEMLLTRKGGGAIALVTTSRPVNTITNSILNKAFYNAWFESANEPKDLGSIFRQTKNKSLSGVANRNFSLLGDPSLRMAPSVENVVVTSIKTEDGSDVLKALSKVTVTGEIRLNNQLSKSFNGTIEAELFDKRTEHVTLGDESSPFTYKLWDHSLFRGKASVVGGEFAFEFVLPEGVSEEINKGKLVLYAYADERPRSARGTLQSIQVGGTQVNPAADVAGPNIELFVGDTTFVNGGYANSNTFLVGKLSDKSGLNISGYGNGNLKAVLDGKTEFLVNDYFVAGKDDFSSGTFSYPISDLDEGQHSISFQAADTYGNVSTSTVNFIVGANGALIVQDLYGYPNPFSETNPVTLEFTHNRAGDDLEVLVAIYNSMGQLADHREYEVPSSTYKVTLFDWNGLSPGGTKMGNGIYLVKVIIRSVSDGAKNDKIARLFLSN